MPLITCNECGNQVSGTAKACPQCGAKGKALIRPSPKKKMGLGGKIFFGGLGAGLLLAALSGLAHQGGAPAAEQPKADTPTNKRNTNIVRYARSLKGAVRNPDSLVYERVLANGDGTLVCFKYRAQNGFGGTTREWAAFTPAGGANEGSAVGMICHDKVMQNVTDAALPLIRLMG